MYLQHEQTSGASPWGPMDIVRNEAFTAREKFELLLQLRGEAAGREHFVEDSYTEAEVEAAIEALRNGLGAEGAGDERN